MHRDRKRRTARSVACPRFGGGGVAPLSYLGGGWVRLSCLGRGYPCPVQTGYPMSCAGLHPILSRRYPPDRTSDKTSGTLTTGTGTWTGLGGPVRGPWTGLGGTTPIPGTGPVSGPWTGLAGTLQWPDKQTENITFPIVLRTGTVIRPFQDSA